MLERVEDTNIMKKPIKEKRCLFFTDEYFIQKGSGVYIRGLIDVFKDVYGENNFFLCIPNTCEEVQDNIICLHKFRSSLPFRIKLKNVFFSGHSALNKNDLKKLEYIIEENDVDTLILGRTLYGLLAYKFRKKEDLRTICICHDVAYGVIKESIKGHMIKKLPKKLFDFLREYIAVKFSDEIIVLNDREKQLYIKSYHKEPDAVIPIFCIDTFDSNKIQNKGINCNLLFIGTDYWPNMNGIIWFIQNVMPSLDNRFVLYVIGKDIDKIKEMLKQSYDNVKIIGTVDSVDSYYYNADIVVGPIFFGSGMKTKTVEALMFGKTYLGTIEALEGYLGMEDFLCNTADEFIDKIHSFYESEGELRFNQYSRSLFEKYYSKEAIKKQIYSILQ